MKLYDVLYIIFTALILAYPLYEKRIIKINYRSKILYYVYSPLAIICLLLILWITVSNNIASNKLDQRLSIQEEDTASLIADSLKISSIELKVRYKFEYKDELTAKIKMDKWNPLKAYFVNADIEKDSIAFECDNPNIYYPQKNIIEFKFDFIPDDLADFSGKPIDFLEKFEKIYFPWKSFIPYLALLKLGGEVERSTDPLLSFQIIINGKVLIDGMIPIKNIDQDSIILIFEPKPEIFSDITNRYLEL